MDKLEKNRDLIKQLICQYSSYNQSSNDFDIQLIFDEVKNHYQWLNIGWKGSTRIYNCIIHIDIKDNKIWLQRNLTDIDIAEDLVNLGVPREDIILGLQPPFKRPYTNYGVA